MGLRMGKWWLLQTVFAHERKKILIMTRKGWTDRLSKLKQKKIPGNDKINRWQCKLNFIYYLRTTSCSCSVFNVHVHANLCSIFFSFHPIPSSDVVPHRYITIRDPWNTFSLGPIAIFILFHSLYSIFFTLPFCTFIVPYIFCLFYRDKFIVFIVNDFQATDF